MLELDEQTKIKCEKERGKTGRAEKMGKVQANSEQKRAWLQQERLEKSEYKRQLKLR
jgi:hypothetical protein